LDFAKKTWPEEFYFSKVIFSSMAFLTGLQYKDGFFTRISYLWSLTQQATPVNNLSVNLHM